MFKRFNMQTLLMIWPAILSAAMYVLVFPMAAISPLAFVFFVPVLVALSEPGTSPKRAFWLFWVAGLLSNIGKMYWLVYTMNHYGFIPIPLALIVFFLMTATLGAFWGMAGAGIYAIKKYSRVPLLFLVPAGWAVMEWYSTWLLSGFPWDQLGNGLVNILPLVQIGDLFGVYGISFVCMVGNVAAAQVYLFFKKKISAFPVTEVAVFAALLVLVLAYGFWRMPNIEKQLSQGKTIRVGLLQANIDQLVKWKQSREMTFNIYRDLVKKTADEGAELIIFPETALPYWQKGERRVSKKVRQFAEETERYVLVGYPLKVRPVNPDAKRRWNKYNAASLIDPQGNLLGTAKKHKLVPFGEFLPFPDQIIWLKNTLGLEKARLTKGFTPAKEYNSIEYPPAGHFGVAICYEVIFPAMVRKIANLGTDFMVTITNDSWFGDTSAPHQHVDQVAMRAIELRRSFARAANTGISCVVDATGKVRNETKTYVRAHAVDEIQTLSIRSVYSRIGDLFVYLMVAALAVCGIIAYKNKRQA